MNIKITDNVAWKGKILKKNSHHDLPTKEAAFLVDAGHATEVEPVKAPQQQQQTPPPAPPVVPPATGPKEK